MGELAAMPAMRETSSPRMLLGEGKTRRIDHPAAWYNKSSSCCHYQCGRHSIASVLVVPSKSIGTQGWGLTFIVFAVGERGPDPPCTYTQVKWHLFH